MRQEDAAAEASARLRALAGLLGVAEAGGGACALAGAADARLAALLQARGAGGGAPRAAGEPVLSRGNLSEAQVRHGACAGSRSGRGSGKPRRCASYFQNAICLSACEGHIPSPCVGTRQRTIGRCSSVAAHQSPLFASGAARQACWHVSPSLFGTSGGAAAAAP